jgi:transposase
MTTTTTTTAATTTIIGMDSSKHSFEQWGADERGRRMLHKRLHRDKVSLFFATIPGVGALVANAIVASVAEPQRFRNGRQFAAYLGLVPRQHTTGGKPKLLGISKAGNRYLRMLQVHGARSSMFHHRGKEDPRSRWVAKLVERRGFHKANVALANKNARVLWKLLTTSGETFARQLAACTCGLTL